VGNLLADGFRAVWFSERAAFLKDKRYAPDECRSCPLFTACQAACPLYWRVNGYDELKAAWKERSAWN